MTVSTKSYDVVIVGGGNAALVAALSAHDAGARVCIVEAAPREERGGNSRFSGAIFRFPHTGLNSLLPLLCDEAKPVPNNVVIGTYSEQAFADELIQQSDGRADRETVTTLVENAYDTLKWMAQKHRIRFVLSIGKYIDSQAASGTNTITLQAAAALAGRGDGPGLVADLWEAVERLPIDVLYVSPAQDLIASGDNILGVRVRQQKSFLDLHGQVILACGSFEANPRLRRQYLGEGWDLVAVRGSMYNTGAMLEKALEYGAQPFGHWGGAHASCQDLNAPLRSNLQMTRTMPRYSYPYGITVNLDGKRFFDEGEAHFSLTYAKTGDVIRQQRGATAYQIFDQKTLHLLDPRYEHATPIIADTIEELAQKIGVNAHELQATLDDFNAACDLENLSKFNPLKDDGLSTSRLSPNKTNWAQPLDRAPFVAYGVTCAITFAYAGLKTDMEGRVINTEEQIMPGLWACGEMTGGLFYFNYPGGSGLTKGATFGKRAGKAAAETALKATEDTQVV